MVTRWCWGRGDDTLEEVGESGRGRVSGGGGGGVGGDMSGIIDG